ncbi:MAG TPA: hypothetical protein VFP84_20115 [Kofleriaceae bacterium]|nr:hypothetical protein [Kofleriaceae bacterium]
MKVLVLELAVVALLAACSSEHPAGPPSDPSAGQPPAEHPVGSPFEQSAPQPTAPAIVSTRVARLPSVEMLAEARNQLGNLHAIGHLTIHAPRVTATQPPAHPFDASSTVVVSAEWLEAFDGSPLVERPFRLPTTIPYFAIKAAIAHTATPELATSALAKLFAIKQIAVLRYIDHDYVAPEIAADGLGRISGWLEIYDVATHQRIGGLTFDFAQTPTTKGDFAEQVRSSIEERVTWYATAFPPAAQ